MRLILFVICIIGSVNVGFATPIHGIVKFNYDYILDGKLEAKRHYKIQLSNDNGKLKGRYIELKNDSLWEFRFYSGRNSIIMDALQVDGSFYRVMSGEFIDNKIVGTWFSVGGLKGDFEILNFK